MHFLTLWWIICVSDHFVKGFSSDPPPIGHIINVIDLIRGKCTFTHKLLMMQFAILNLQYKAPQCNSHSVSYWMRWDERTVWKQVQCHLLPIGHEISCDETRTTNELSLTAWQPYGNLEKGSNSATYFLLTMRKGETPGQKRQSVTHILWSYGKRWHVKYCYYSLPVCNGMRCNWTASQDDQQCAYILGQELVSLSHWHAYCYLHPITWCQTAWVWMCSITHELFVKDQCDRSLQLLQYYLPTVVYNYGIGSTCRKITLSLTSTSLSSFKKWHQTSTNEIKSIVHPAYYCCTPCKICRCCTHILSNNIIITMSLIFDKTNVLFL